MGRKKSDAPHGLFCLCKKMREQLRESGMSEEDILQVETASIAESAMGVGMDENDYDPTYDREVRLAIREDERKYIYNW